MSRELRTPREKEGKTINIFTNTPDIPLRELILRNGCHGLSSLNIKSLDTNLNNNEKNQFERHYKSYRVGWLHDEVKNSFMFRLTEDLPILFTAHHQSLYLLHMESHLVDFRKI